MVLIATAFFFFFNLFLKKAQALSLDSALQIQYVLYFLLFYFHPFLCLLTDILKSVFRNNDLMFHGIKLLLVLSNAVDVFRIKILIFLTRLLLLMPILSVLHGLEFFLFF